MVGGREGVVVDYGVVGAGDLVWGEVRFGGYPCGWCGGVCEELAT